MEGQSPAQSPSNPSASPTSPSGTPASAADKALISAARAGDVEAVQKLVGTANLWACDRFGSTALHVAVQKNALEVIKILTRAGADVNRKDGRSNTPLHIAAMHLHNDALRFLAKPGSGVLIDQLNERGHTALSLAAYNGGTEMVETLVELGANVNGIPGGQIPLHCSVMPGHPPKSDLYQLLLRLGADLNKQDHQGNSILHVLDFMNFNREQQILALAPNFNAVNNKGETPLHFAVRSGRNQSVIDLLGRGANVEGSECADSPLIEAIRGEHTGIVKALLVAGADPNRPAKTDGRTPLAIARSLADGVSREIVEELQFKGARDTGSRNP